jgi:hypothetical protein
MEPNGELVKVTNFALVAEDGSVSRSVIALGAVLIVVAAVNLFTLFVSLFSNFELVKRGTILSMLLLAGYYILVLIYSLLTPGASDEAILDLSKPVLFPFVALAFNVISFMLVRRKEAKIVAQALGFRLRD